MDIVILTHTDLDGVSSGFIAEKVFKAKSVISSNYVDIADKLKHIHDTYGAVHLVITDLHVEPMDVQYALKTFKSVKLFDHHAQTEKYFQLPEIDNRFELYYDKSRSATQIVFDYGEENGYEFSETERKYVRYVNMFDLWMHREKEFVYARIINELYWRDKFFTFLGKLRSGGALDVPNGLSEADLKYCRDSFEKIDSVKNTAEWFNTEQNSAIIFLKEDEKSAINHIPQLMSSCSKTGIFYIVYRGYDKYMCSVRVDDSKEPDFEMGNLMKKFAKTEDDIISAGGHDYAGAMSFKPHVTLKGVVELIDKLEGIIHPDEQRDFWDDDIPF